MHGLIHKLRAYVRDCLADQTPESGGRKDDRRRLASRIAGFGLASLQDVRFGMWKLRKSPGFTAVAVLTLMLAIGVNTAIFSIVGAILRPLPFPQSDRLVELNESHRKEAVLGSYGVSLPNFRGWQAQSRSFTHIAFYGGWEFWLAEGAQVSPVRGKNVSSQFLQTLDVRPMWGRGLSTEDGKDGGAALVGFDLWRRLFGSETNLAGKTITVNEQRRVVVGVMPPGFGYPNGTQVWLPLPDDLPANDPVRARDWRLGAVIGRLGMGVDLRQAQAEMDRLGLLLEEQYPTANANWGVRVSPLHDKLIESVRPALPVFGVVAACILLIACANLGNLLLSRATTRRKEFAIRASLGAGRGRLARQLITESLMLSAFGGMAGFLAVWSGRALLAKLAGQYLPRFAEIRIDPSVFLFSLGATVVTGLLCGLAPVWQVRRTDIHGALKDGGSRATTDRATTWLRSALAATELALAMVLLIGAGLSLRSVYYLLHPGLDSISGQVVEVQVELPKFLYRENTARLDFHTRLLDRIRSLPGIEAAGAASWLEFSRGARSPITLDTASGGGTRWTWSCAVSPGFFEALRLPLLRGRDVSSDDRPGAPEVAVVNETMARSYWPGQEPLGKRFRTGDANSSPWITVVGVVRDLRAGGVNDTWRPAYYRSHLQSPYLGSIVVRASTGAKDLPRQLQSVIRETDSRLPSANIQTLEAVLDESASEAVGLGRILISLASLALVLAVVGTYGVIAYTVSQRRHEFGVRIALGASRREIALLVLRWGGRLAVAGTALGLALAWSSTRVLAGLLEGVSPTDPIVFAGVPFVLCVITLLACWVPARRATQVDPMESLRAG